ncbi:MAG: response regulator transcription factor [Nitrospira sp.]|nr:response regulator transcription factor [Nitrospira sp.]
MPEQIRVLLVDDSVVVLHGLKTILDEDKNIVIVGTASTHDEAIAAVGQHRPDVVLLDVQLGSANGIDLCETLRHRFPQTSICFLTAYEDRALLRAAIRAGAQGYLLKSCSGVEVARSIAIVAEGKAVVDPTLVTQVMTWIRDGAQGTRRQSIEDCSKSDFEVLSHIAAGKSNKEIAQELHATPARIASRIQAIYKRLKISRRSEATSCFVRWRERLPRSMPNGTALIPSPITRHLDDNG